MCLCSHHPCDHSPSGDLGGTVTVKTPEGRAFGSTAFPVRPAVEVPHTRLTYEVVKIEKGALLGHVYYDVVLTDVEPSQMERSSHDLMPSSGEMRLRLPAASSCQDYPVGRRFTVALTPILPPGSSGRR